MGPSIDARNFFDLQSIQNNNGKTVVLIGMKTTGNQVKANNFPSKDLWANEAYAPWGMGSTQFCISSWQDIDKATPSVQFPADVHTNNRLFSQLNENDKCFFVVYKKDSLYYLIYLAALSSIYTPGGGREQKTIYKCILGVASIIFDDRGQAVLKTKREFTNRNAEATIPETGGCEPITFQLGSHWLWFIYAFRREYSSEVGDFRAALIDADDIIKFAP